MQATITTEHRDIDALRAFLDAQPAGPVANTVQLVTLLDRCWQLFAGSGETGMRADKLPRMEQPIWNPPVLTFMLERHGQTVMGSTRATIYEWQVDLTTLTASNCPEMQRQVRPSDRRLDVKPIAEELAKAIINGRSDDRLKIIDADRVALNIGRVIPETCQQTTGARRKRLRNHLSALLAPHGWRMIRPNVYARLPE
jgi:hypothetical protein